jgi:hypothetical protein
MARSITRSGRAPPEPFGGILACYVFSVSRSALSVPYGRSHFCAQSQSN